MKIELELHEFETDKPTKPGNYLIGYWGNEGHRVWGIWPWTKAWQEVWSQHFDLYWTELPENLMAAYPDVPTGQAGAKGPDDGPVAKELVEALSVVSEQFGGLKGLLMGLVLRWEMSASGLEETNQDDVAYGLYECADELQRVLNGEQLDGAQMDLPAPEAKPDAEAHWDIRDLREKLADLIHCQEQIWAQVNLGKGIPSYGQLSENAKINVRHVADKVLELLLPGSTAVFK